MSEYHDSSTLRQDSEGPFKVRILIQTVVALLLILAIVARLAQIQILQHESYSVQSIENRIAIRAIAPPRGLIYDRNGVLLADNRQIVSLAVVPEQVADMDTLLQELGSRVLISDRQRDAFERRIRQPRPPYEPIVLRRVLRDDEQARLAIDRYRFPSVVVTQETVRDYPYGELTTHAIGSVRRISENELRQVDAVQYMGTDFIGRLGIEKFYERSLHGQVGYSKVETDVYGRQIEQINREEPMIGASLTLHLDLKLQETATAALGDRRGAVVAIDPNTGGILALVSLPSYEPNQFITGITQANFDRLSNSIDKPMFNRAVRGLYPPGSTFKPVVALAALETGATDWEATINDRGVFRLPGSTREYRDWNWTKNNPGGQGVVDLERAIYRSSNIYFFDVAARIGVTPIASMAQRLGFGRAIPLDLPNAESGIAPTEEWKRERVGEPWYPGDSVILGIGQGYLLATPLQLASYCAALARGGTWIAPRMLKSSNQQLFEVPLHTAAPSSVGDPEFIAEHWSRLTQAMELVVHRGNLEVGENGTAWAHIGVDVPYRMAAKSGTAQVVGIAQGDEYIEEELAERERKHALFMAFAPVENPRIAVAVIVENGGGGSSVAGPVARAVLDEYLVNRMVASDG